MKKKKKKVVWEYLIVLILQKLPTLILFGNFPKKLVLVREDGREEREQRREEDHVTV